MLVGALGVFVDDFCYPGIVFFAEADDFYHGRIISWYTGAIKKEVLMANYAIAAEIAANNQDEQGAIEGYLRLLEMLTDPKDIAQIQEIMSDEKEHSHRLTEMQRFP